MLRTIRNQTALWRVVESWYERKESGDAPGVMDCRIDDGGDQYSLL